MLRYELLMLAVPEITQDEIKGLETLIEKTIQDAQGSVLSFDRWGKHRLAFPVRKSDYGVYFLVRFEMKKTEPLLGEIASLFSIKLTTIVMRHVVTRLDLDKSLAYERPVSVEDAPARDVDSFLRKNKMGGLIGGRAGAGRSESTQSGEWVPGEDEEGVDMLDLDDQEAVS